LVHKINEESYAICLDYTDIFLTLIHIILTMIYNIDIKEFNQILHSCVRKQIWGFSIHFQDTASKSFSKLMTIYSPLLFCKTTILDINVSFFNVLINMK